MGMDASQAPSAELLAGLVQVVMVASGVRSPSLVAAERHQAANYLVGYDVHRVFYDPAPGHYYYQQVTLGDTPSMLVDQNVARYAVHEARSAMAVAAAIGLRLAHAPAFRFTRAAVSRVARFGQTVGATMEALIGEIEAFYRLASGDGGKWGALMKAEELFDAGEWDVVGSKYVAPPLVELEL
jgi:hypothetical protein